MAKVIAFPGTAPQEPEDVAPVDAAGTSVDEMFSFLMDETRLREGVPFLLVLHAGGDGVVLPAPLLSDGRALAAFSFSARHQYPHYKVTGEGVSVQMSFPWGDDLVEFPWSAVESLVTSEGIRYLCRDGAVIELAVSPEGQEGAN